LRKEYLFRKNIEEKEAVVQDKKRKLREALDEGKAIPTDLRGEAKLLTKVDLDDKRTENTTTHIDDEYAFAGIKDPKVLITTSRHPSTRLSQFAKELKLIIPGSLRIQRGAYVVKDLVHLGRSNDVTDLILIHEHRGQPSGLIISHLPHGPTCYFSLTDVIERHDLPEKPANMSEAPPHLIFHNFSSKLGSRVQDVLKYLFPPPSPLGKRVLAFHNSHDIIAFRHYVWTTDGDAAAGVKPGDPKLTEVGPRFSMRLYKIELGTIEMKDLEVEWTLRPFFNKQKAVI